MILSESISAIAETKEFPLWIQIILPFLLTVFGGFLVRLAIYLKKRNDIDNKNRMKAILYLEWFKEEVSTGLEIMEKTYELLKKDEPELNLSGLPGETWQRITSMSEDVMLKIYKLRNEVIIEEEELEPYKSLTHLKNYFVNIRANYHNELKKANRKSEANLKDWEKDFIKFLERVDDNNHLICTKKVFRMIDKAIELLEDNIYNPYFYLKNPIP